MKLSHLITTLGLMTLGTSFGATGTFGSGLTFVTSSTASTPIASGDRSSSSAATELGTFGIGVGNTLNLTGAGILTWKSGGGDVSDAKFNYRIYTVGSSPGAFIEKDLDWGSNSTFTEYGITGAGGSDQFWGDSDTYGGGFASVNLLQGLDSGDYQFEWYSHAVTNEGIRYESNGGPNYKATFTVVPEPSAALLGGLGLLGLLRRRRA